MGYAKINKRHAQESMIKRRRRKKDSPYPRKREKEIKRDGS
jgi:hypothetical protein